MDRGVRWRRSSQKLKLLKNSLEHRDYRGPRYHLESLGEVETNSLLNHYSLDAAQLDLHSLLHAELDVPGTAFEPHPCHAAYRETVLGVADPRSSNMSYGCEGRRSTCGGVRLLGVRKYTCSYSVLDDPIIASIRHYTPGLFYSWAQLPNAVKTNFLELCSMQLGEEGEGGASPKNSWRIIAAI